MTTQSIVNIVLDYNEVKAIYNDFCIGFNDPQLNKYFGYGYMFENTLSSCIYEMVCAIDEVGTGDVDNRWTEASNVYPSTSVEGMFEDLANDYHEIAEYDYSQHDCVVTGQKDAVEVFILDKVFRSINNEYAEFYHHFVNYLIFNKIHHLFEVFIDIENALEIIQVDINCNVNLNILVINIYQSSSDAKQHPHIQNTMTQVIRKGFNRRK